MTSTSNNRILVLRQIEGEQTKSATGLVDKRLFSGENKLHAIMGPNSLWSMKYEMGGLPEPLKQKFTSFPKLMTHARGYFAKRGVEIAEVLEDVEDRYTG